MITHERLAHPACTFLQLILGLGIGATIVFLLGLIGYIRITLPAASVLSLVFLRKHIIAWWKGLASYQSLLVELGRYEKTLLGLILLLLTAALITSSAPPIHYDALTYHLALPEIYLLNNRISALPEIVRSGMPQLGEMIYLWAGSIGGSAAAAVTGWFTGSMALLALIGTLRRVFSLRSTWVGVAALASGTSIISALGWAYIDWFCFLFGLAGLISLTHWVQDQKTSTLILTGLFAGFAVASKYTAGVFAVGILVFLLFFAIQHKENFLKRTVLFIGSFLIPILPWLIKNLVSTGNPLYPYFSFSGSFSAERAAILQNLPPFGNWTDLFLLPFRATTIGAEGLAGYSHSIGPLLLILGVFAWMNTRPDNKPDPLCSSARWISLTGLIIWAAANQFNGILVQTRMYYVLFPAFTILAAAGFQFLASLSIPRLKLDWLLPSFVILVLGLAVLQNLTGLIRDRAVGYLTGSISREEYVAHNLGWYAPAMEKIISLPSTERTLLLYEPRGSYCLPLCTADELLDRWSYSLEVNNNLPGEVIEAWKEQGYTHLLVNKAGIAFLKQGNDPHHPLDNLLLLEDTLSSLPVEENFGDSYLLYSLK